LELAEAEEEEADNMSFVDLCEQIEALERRVKVERRVIVQEQHAHPTVKRGSEQQLEKR
jgi:hypothetical protein